MKSIFMEIFFQDSFMPVLSESSARNIDSLLLLCILARVYWLRLCIHKDIRFTPSRISHATYSVVISSGLDSNDISAPSRFGKQERMPSTSPSFRIDGVHPPK